LFIAASRMAVSGSTFARPSWQIDFTKVE